MALKCRYKWVEIRHRQVYEPDGFYTVDGETEFLNTIMLGDVKLYDSGYETKEEAISDLDRLLTKYPAYTEKYTLVEEWSKL